MLAAVNMPSHRSMEMVCRSRLRRRELMLITIGTRDAFERCWISNIHAKRMLLNTAAHRCGGRVPVKNSLRFSVKSLLLE